MPTMRINVTGEHSQGAHSTSGARLYVMGDRTWAKTVLQMVASLMLESDFDVGVLTVTLPDRIEHPWGLGIGQTDPRGVIGVQEAYRSKDMLEQAAKRCEIWPLNSLAQTTMATLIFEWVAEELQLEWDRHLSGVLEGALGVSQEPLPSSSMAKPCKRCPRSSHRSKCPQRQRPVGMKRTNSQS